jgi:hypothetical protein
MTRSRSTIRRPLALLLVLACLPGAGLLALNRSDPDLMVKRLSPAAIAQGAPSKGAVTIPGQPAAVRTPPANRFAVIALRPLFTPGRRPPAAPGAPAAAPTEQTVPDALVTGIVLAGEDSVAIIEPARPGPDTRALVVRVGQVIAGWKVEAIDADRVILSHDGKRYEMMLIKEDRSRRANAVRRMNTPAQRRVAPAQQAPAQAPNLPRQQPVVPQPQTR